MTIKEYRQYLDMMNQWLILEQEGKRIDRFIKRQGWNKIAVYGMGIYGRHVIRELENTDCQVIYAIDQKRMENYKKVKIWRPVDVSVKVDAIINSVIHEHSKIANEMSYIVSCPVVSLEDVVFESY